MTDDRQVPRSSFVPYLSACPSASPFPGHHALSAHTLLALVRFAKNSVVRGCRGLNLPLFLDPVLSFPAFPSPFPSDRPLPVQQVRSGIMKIAVFLALGLAVPSVVAQQPGSFLVAGQTLVSAMMVCPFIHFPDSISHPSLVSDVCR